MSTINKRHLAAGDMKTEPMSFRSGCVSLTLSRSPSSPALSCGSVHESAPAIQSRQHASAHPGVSAFPALSKFQSKLQNKRGCRTSADAWVKPDETPLLQPSAAKNSLRDILYAETLWDPHISLRNKDIPPFWRLWKWSWLGPFCVWKLLRSGWKPSTHLHHTNSHDHPDFR